MYASCLDSKYLRHSQFGVVNSHLYSFSQLCSCKKPFWFPVYLCLFLLFLSGFLELDNFAAKFSYQCHSLERNSVCCLMFEIDFNPLLGADESHGGFYVGEYHMCCCWRFLKMCIIVTVSPQFLFSLFFGFLFFITCWYVMLSEITITFWADQLSILFSLTIVDMKKFSVVKSVSGFFSGIS